MPTLLEITSHYLSSRAVCEDYAKHVTRIAERCGDVGTAHVNGYLKKRLEKVSSITVKNERTILLFLWRFAYENELLDLPPRGVLRIKASRAPTRAWTQEQCRSLAANTSTLTGTLRSGAPLGLFMRTWILLGYQSGSRRGDLWAMKGSHFEGNILRWTQHKTGDPLHKKLTPACMEAVNEMLRLAPDGTVLGWACRKRQAMRLMKTYLMSQGLPGTSKWLRRSGATHIEIDQPGKARLHLGHRSVQLAAQSYIDWSQVNQNAPETPLLID